MLEQLLQNFPKNLVINCLQDENAIYFEVFDNNNSCCEIVFERGKGHFRIKNPNEKMLSFLAIDKCLLLSDKYKKADFAIFDNESFCFIEIKDVSISNRSKAKKNAIEQLAATILKFKEQGVDFSNYKVEAIIALTNKRSHPIASTRLQNRIAEFYERTGAKLLAGNEKTFI